MTDGSPDTTEIVIRPSRGWRDLGLGELVGTSELLYFLVWRDLKVRYRQTVFGVLWALLQPILMTGVLTLFLGRLKGIGPEGVPYPVFVLSGLVAWNLFGQAFSASSSSLVNAASLLQKVYVPRLLLPIAAIGVYLIDHLVGLGTLVVVMLLYGVAFQPTIVVVPLLSVLVILTSLSFSLWASALNVRYRDVRYVVPFLTQLWFLATPVAYTSSLFPAELQGYLALNPMIVIVNGFRWAILGQPAPTLEAVALSLAVSAVALASGLIYFRRVERTFADVI